MADNERNRYLDILKGLCMISVICAHCSTLYEGAQGINIYVTRVLDSIGAVGVPILFAISGYLFHNTKKLKKFITQKLTTIVVPWLFAGTVVWLYMVLRKGGITVVNWLKFLGGYGSYLYYLPMLMICFIFL